MSQNDDGGSDGGSTTSIGKPGAKGGGVVPEGTVGIGRKRPMSCVGQPKKKSSESPSSVDKASRTIDGDRERMHDCGSDDGSTASIGKPGAKGGGVVPEGTVGMGNKRPRGVVARPKEKDSASSVAKAGRTVGMGKKSASSGAKSGRTIDGDRDRMHDGGIDKPDTKRDTPSDTNGDDQNDNTHRCANNTMGQNDPFGFDDDLLAIDVDALVIERESQRLEKNDKSVKGYCLDFGGYSRG